jgi:hypothetical protein
MTTPALQWKAIVTDVIRSPEFLDAWRELETCGLASREAIEESFRLIGDSEYHCERLIKSVREIVLMAAQWAPPFIVDEEIAVAHLDQFEIAVMSILQTQVACYLLLGALVGIGSMIGVKPEYE